MIIASPRSQFVKENEKFSIILSNDKIKGKTEVTELSNVVRIFENPASRSI